jgi:hypothetical protein
LGASLRDRATPERSRYGVSALRGGIDLRKNCSADQLRNLWDYGVPEGSNSVHIGGNPISHSTNSGFGMPVACSAQAVASSKRCQEDRPAEISFAIAVCGFRAPRFAALGVGQYRSAAANPLRGSLAILPRFCGSLWRGVGHNPYPVTLVRGANVGSWYAMPLRIIPDRGQGSENGIQPSRKQRADVLQDDEARSQFANKTGDLVEQAAAFPAQSGAEPGKADILAGEPATDNIDGNSIGSKSFAGKLSHIGVAGDTRPMLGEDAAGEVFDFAECDGFKSTSSLQS